MSAEGATALYERINSDEQFRAEIEAAETQEERRRIVTEAGYDVSRDDAPTIRNIAGMSELSDEDLDKVSGAGAWTDLAEVGVIILGASTPVGAIALVAVVAAQ